MGRTARRGAQGRYHRAVGVVQEPQRYKHGWWIETDRCVGRGVEVDVKQSDWGGEFHYDPSELAVDVQLVREDRSCLGFGTRTETAVGRVDFSKKHDQTKKWQDSVDGERG